MFEFQHQCRRRDACWSSHFAIHYLSNKVIFSVNQQTPAAHCDDRQTQHNFESMCDRVNEKTKLKIDFYSCELQTHVLRDIRSFNLLFSVVSNVQMHVEHLNIPTAANKNKKQKWIKTEKSKRISVVSVQPFSLLKWPMRRQRKYVSGIKRVSSDRLKWLKMRNEMRFHMKWDD